MPEAIAIVCIGVATFLMRYSFIGLAGRIRPAPAMQRGLRYVPPAVLTALVAPTLVAPSGDVDLSPANAHLIAGIVAILLAWRTRNVFLTLAGGFAVLWLLLWLQVS